MGRMRALVLFLFAWLLPVASARADERQGAVVIARTVAVERAAEELARAAYQEPLLRPLLDELTVRAVLGGPLAAESPPRALELRRVARAAAEEADPAIAARLLRGLGGELGVALVLVVAGDEAAPSARAFVVAEGRFSPATFAPAPLAPTPPLHDGAAAPPTLPPRDWSDAVSLLRGLVRPAAPPAVPVAPLAPVSKAPTAPPPARRGFVAEHLLRSPWFWGGLAAVAAVGATVIILSQTTLNEPDTVVLGGRIAP